TRIGDVVHIAHRFAEGIDEVERKLQVLAQRSFAAASRSPARSSARAETASCAFSGETALPSVTYRASQRSAAGSNLIGSCSAYSNNSLSASSSVRRPI